MRYSAFVSFDSRPTTVHTISIPSSDSNVLPPHHQQQIVPYHLHAVVLPPSASNTPHRVTILSNTLVTVFHCLSVPATYIRTFICLPPVPITSRCSLLCFKLRAPCAPHSFFWFCTYLLMLCCTRMLSASC